MQSSIGFPYMPSALITDLSWEDLTPFGSDFNGQAIYDLAEWL